MNETLLRTEELTVVFGGLVALSGLDLEIRRGEIVGLIGPNGAGKTTAFNAITGVIQPSSGRVLLGEEDITARPAPKIAAKGIARTFQQIRLYDDLTVIENVMVAGHSSVRYNVFEAVTGLGRYFSDEKRISDYAEYLLDLMGLSDVISAKASALPYGRQRKLEIARALALHPTVLLLDEPVAGMNPMETKGFADILRRIHAELNLTIGLIDHDMGFVMNVCDKIKVIDHGIPIAWGTPEEIRADQKVIAAYLGTAA